MSGDIKAVFADIQKASIVFEDCGKRYGEIVADSVGAIPVVTDDSLRDAITATLEAISTLHNAIGASMRVHGDKLEIVHGRYANTDCDLEDLVRSIDSPTDIQPRLGS